MEIFLKFILILDWDYDLYHHLMSSNDSGNKVDEDTLDNVDKENAGMKNVQNNCTKVPIY